MMALASVCHDMCELLSVWLRRLLWLWFSSQSLGRRPSSVDLEVKGRLSGYPAVLKRSDFDLAGKLNRVPENDENIRKMMGSMNPISSY